MRSLFLRSAFLLAGLALLIDAAPIPLANNLITLEDHWLASGTVGFVVKVHAVGAVDSKAQAFWKNLVNLKGFSTKVPNADADVVATLRKAEEAKITQLVVKIANPGKENDLDQEGQTQQTALAGIKGITKVGAVYLGEFTDNVCVQKNNDATQTVTVDNTKHNCRYLVYEFAGRDVQVCMQHNAPCGTKCTQAAWREQLIRSVIGVTYKLHKLGYTHGDIGQHTGNMMFLGTTDPVEVTDGIKMIDMTGMRKLDDGHVLDGQTEFIRAGADALYKIMKICNGGTDITTTQPNECYSKIHNALQAGIAANYNNVKQLLTWEKSMVEFQC